MESVVKYKMHYIKIEIDGYQYIIDYSFRWNKVKINSIGKFSSGSKFGEPIKFNTVATSTLKESAMNWLLFKGLKIRKKLRQKKGQRGGSRS